MSELEPVETTDVEIVDPNNTSTATPAYPEIDYTVSDDTANLIDRAISPNRERAYNKDIHTFMSFCAETGRTPVPATPETLAEFVGYLIRTPGDRATRRSPATIARVLSHVRTLNRDRAGRTYTKSEMKGANKALAGYRDQRAQQGTSNRTRTAAPILAVDLAAMVATCDNSPIGRRDRTILVVGWLMMARRSELAYLNLADIQVRAEGLDVYIGRSKTDQDAHGATCFLPTRGAPRDCNPTDAFQSWTQLLNEQTVPPLFRPINWGRIESRRLSEYSINEMIKRRAAAAHYEDGAPLPHADEISAHSLRAGGATQSYLSGTPLSQIMEHGRWSQNSAAVMGYIREADKIRNNAMARVWS